MPTMEEYGVVLEFLPYGRSTDTGREPLAQVVGETYFTLLEVVPKPKATLTAGERVYIGKDERDKIDHIRGRIEYDGLTSSARSELKPVLTMIVKTREQEFVNFVNRCGPVTIRLHQLELLPGVGKKHLIGLLDEREKKPFENFADINKRVPLMTDFSHIIVQRIEDEMLGKSKYYILTRPPHRPER
ncbi:MAG: DUF655 domain-containing protein [Candidatus Micrarchaeota archaeon]|nr:DUF655 domain-containing protein [Candidatus Micrarchaeota archaeon]